MTLSGSVVVLFSVVALSADDATSANNSQNKATSNAAADNNNRQNQNTDRQNQQNRNGQAGDERFAGQTRNEGHWNEPDHQFATCVAFANQVEVAMAKIANQKSKNAEVKRFAEMMIQDHEQFLQKLEKFAPEATRRDALSSVSDTSRQSDGDTGQTSKSSTIRQTRSSDENKISPVRTAEKQSVAGTDDQGRSANSLQIERELAEQCVSSGRRKLESKDAADFDKCYMHEQVAKHQEMKDKLTVFQRHASGSLATVLSEGLKTTEHHLAKAEEIVKSLEGGTASDRSSNR